MDSVRDGEIHGPLPVGGRRNNRCHRHPARNRAITVFRNGPEIIISSKSRWRIIAPHQRAVGGPGDSSQRAVKKVYPRRAVIIRCLPLIRRSRNAADIDRKLQCLLREHRPARRFHGRRRGRNKVPIKRFKEEILDLSFTQGIGENRHLVNGTIKGAGTVSPPTISRVTAEPSGSTIKGFRQVDDVVLNGLLQVGCGAVDIIKINARVGWRDYPGTELPDARNRIQAGVVAPGTRAVAVPGITQFRRAIPVHGTAEANSGAIKPIAIHQQSPIGPDARRIRINPHREGHVLVFRLNGGTDRFEPARPFMNPAHALVFSRPG